MSLPASDYLEEIRLIDLDEKLSDEDEPETPCPGHLDQVGVDPDGFAKCQRCGMEWGGCRGYDEAVVPPHNELQPGQQQEAGFSRALPVPVGDEQPESQSYAEWVGIDRRRLSGMTKGARKRAALWSVFVPWSIKEYGYDPQKEPRAERRHMRVCLINLQLRASYQEARLRWGLRGKQASEVKIHIGIKGAEELRAAAVAIAEELAGIESAIHVRFPSALSHSPRKFLRGEMLAYLIPAWLAKQVGLPEKPTVATLVNLIEHRAHGAALQVLVGDRVFPAALLLAALNLFENYLAPKAGTGRQAATEDVDY